MNMTKSILTAGMAAGALVAFADWNIPGTAKSFRDINIGKTPIVTNAEEAVWGALKPGDAAWEATETDDLYFGKLTCTPNKLNIMNTANPRDLMDLDYMELWSKGDYRTWELYFGPEYRPLILESKEKAITLRFANGIAANGSTNDILMTQVPAIIKTRELMDKQLLISIEYLDHDTQFGFKHISLTGIDVDGGVIKITGENLDKVANTAAGTTVGYFSGTGSSATTNTTSFSQQTNWTNWVYSDGVDHELFFHTNKGDLDEMATGWYFKGNVSTSGTDKYDVFTAVSDTNTPSIVVNMTDTYGIHFEFTVSRSVDSIDLVNGTLAATLPGFGSSPYTFIVTTDKDEYYVEYETKVIAYPSVLTSAPAPMNSERDITFSTTKDDAEKKGFCATILSWFGL